MIIIPNVKTQQKDNSTELYKGIVSTIHISRQQKAKLFLLYKSCHLLDYIFNLLDIL